MIRAPVRILIVGALCVLGLVGIVVRESMARDAGTEILLAIEAVDPRTLLQGHYVTLDIRERLEPEAPCPPTNAAPNQGWVALAPDGDTYHAVRGAGLREEAETPGAILARGGLYCEEASPGVLGVGSRPAFVTLDLGINQFYVDQTHAERIDRILREQRPGDEARVYAIVSIGQDGRARLKGLIVDGERLELGWT